MTTEVRVTEGQRADFEKHGYVIIPGALSTDETAFYRDALDRTHARECRSGQAMHLLGAVAHCREMADLVDHPATFPWIWSLLGWNIHIYHSHLDVHPPIREPKPFRFEWHQDGGRQNREIETSPRPRLSVKTVFWLSDVSAPGRGNFKIIPGSHLRDRIAGPPRRDVAWPDPEGAIEVTAGPGDAVIFDRRLWHARSDNHSELTRKAVFFGYTYRWITGRDAVPSGDFTPIQRQLLGMIPQNGDHAWGHFPERTPLYGDLLARGLLTRDHPPLYP